MKHSRKDSTPTSQWAWLFQTQKTRLRPTQSPFRIYLMILKNNYRVEWLQRMLSLCTLGSMSTPRRPGSSKFRWSYHWGRLLGQAAPRNLALARMRSPNIHSLTWKMRTLSRKSGALIWLLVQIEKKGCRIWGSSKRPTTSLWRWYRRSKKPRHLHTLILGQIRNETSWTYFLTCGKAQLTWIGLQQENLSMNKFPDLTDHTSKDLIHLINSLRLTPSIHAKIGIRYRLLIITHGATMQQRNWKRLMHARLRYTQIKNIIWDHWSLGIST